LPLLDHLLAMLGGIDHLLTWVHDLPLLVYVDHLLARISYLLPLLVDIDHLLPLIDDLLPLLVDVDHLLARINDLLPLLVEVHHLLWLSRIEELLTLRIDIDDLLLSGSLCHLQRLPLLIHIEDLLPRMCSVSNLLRRGVDELLLRCGRVHNLLLLSTIIDGWWGSIHHLLWLLHVCGTRLHRLGATGAGTRHGCSG